MRTKASAMLGRYRLAASAYSRRRTIKGGKRKVSFDAVGERRREKARSHEETGLDVGFLVHDGSPLRAKVVRRVYVNGRIGSSRTRDERKTRTKARSEWRSECSRQRSGSSLILLMPSSSTLKYRVNSCIVGGTMAEGKEGEGGRERERDERGGRAESS